MHMFILRKVELKTSISSIVSVAKNQQVTFLEKSQYKIFFFSKNPRGEYVIYYLNAKASVCCKAETLL